MQTLKKKVKGDGAVFEAPMSLLEMVKAPGVAYVLFLYTHVMLLGLAYTAGMSITLFESTAHLRTSLTIISFSNTCFLVHTPRPRWLRLQSHANIPFHWEHRHLASHLATVFLPDLTTEI
jgi:hypothetical protein